MKPKPPCVEVRAFIRARAGRAALAPLTGQDARALETLAHLAELFACSDRRGRDAALAAMQAIAECAMQPSVKPLAWLAFVAACDEQGADVVFPDVSIPAGWRWAS